MSYQDSSVKSKVYFSVEKELDECQGYWFAVSSSEMGQASIMSVMPRFKQVHSTQTNDPILGVRPVVSMPTEVIGKDVSFGKKRFIL